MFNNPKIRRILIWVHLYIAAFMAPAFALVAISGFNYLIDQRGDATRTEISLPADATLNPDSETLAADVQALLASAGEDAKISGVQTRRGGDLATQPVTRTHYTLRITPEGVTANKVKPNLQQSMLEIHKGHGPAILNFYHKLVAIGMLIVVFGGVLVGVFAKAYRKPTLITTAVGTVLYIAAAMFM